MDETLRIWGEGPRASLSPRSTHEGWGLANPHCVRWCRSTGTGDRSFYAPPTHTRRDLHAYLQQQLGHSPRPGLHRVQAVKFLVCPPGAISLSHWAAGQGRGVPFMPASPTAPLPHPPRNSPLHVLPLRQFSLFSTGHLVCEDCKSLRALLPNSSFPHWKPVCRQDCLSQCRFRGRRWLPATDGVKRKLRFHLRGHLPPP